MEFFVFGFQNELWRMPHTELAAEFLLQALVQLHTEHSKTPPYFHMQSSIYKWSKITDVDSDSDGSTWMATPIMSM